MLVKVNSTLEIREREFSNEKYVTYVFRFGLPPLYPNGPERGRLRLPLPENKVIDNCTLYFGRMPLLYPRRIKIVNRSDVYVERGASFPASINEVWKVFIEISPYSNFAS